MAHRAFNLFLSIQGLQQFYLMDALLQRGVRLIVNLLQQVGGVNYAAFQPFFRCDTHIGAQLEYLGVVFQGLTKEFYFLTNACIGETDFEIQQVSLQIQFMHLISNQRLVVSASVKRTKVELQLDAQKRIEKRDYGLSAP